ncbi:MAG: type VII secretion integral membrane protein EccD [Mycobacteriaceae bacterium]|nr:type VII secretion integral membrane protein EccD [Mycobacteriaceae bacterium]
MTGTVLPIVRVAILTENRLADIALPAELPLREIVPAVQRLVGSAGREEHVDDDEVVGSRATNRLSLAPIGGAPFSLDASLDTVGVVDGDLLMLQDMPAGPAAPGIVEDIADAAMIFSQARRKPWSIKHIQRGATAASIALAWGVTGLAVTHRLATGSWIGLLAVAVIAVLTAATALLSVTRSPRTSLALSIAAGLPIAAALALSVPGSASEKFGAAQLMLGAAGVAGWSLISMLLPSPQRARGIGFFTAATVVGVVVVLAAGAELLWRPTVSNLGCGLMVAALFIVVQAASGAALCARFPLPVIPAPGDPTPSAPSIRVLQDLPRRVRAADAHQSGFIAAAVLLSVLGSVALAARPETLSGWGWYVVAAMTFTAVLRARIWDSTVCKAWLLAQPYLLGVVLLVVYTATGRYGAACGAGLALGVLTLVWVIVAMNPPIAVPDSYSLPVRRLLGLLAWGLDISLIPVLAYLVGVFGWVLNR